MNKTDRRNNFIRLFVPLALIAAFCFFGNEKGILAVADRPLFAILLAWGAYLLSHLFRATRLAILATPVMSVKIRSLFLLHFHAAVVVLTCPFKLGELYRMRELALISRDYGRAFLVVVMERALDAFILILLCLGLGFFQATIPGYLAVSAMVFAVVISVAFFIMFVVGPFLQHIQKHIFRNHVSPAARFALRSILSLHQAIDVSLRCLNGKLILLLGMTVLIWSCEVLALTLIAPVIIGNLGHFVIDNVLLPMLPEAGASNHPYYLLALWFQFLSVAWAASIIFYLGALKKQKPVDAVNAAPAPLAAYLRPHDIKLRPTRRTSYYAD